MRPADLVPEQTSLTYRDVLPPCGDPALAGRAGVQGDWRRDMEQHERAAAVHRRPRQRLAVRHHGRRDGRPARQLRGASHVPQHIGTEQAALLPSHATQTASRCCSAGPVHCLAYATLYRRPSGEVLLSETVCVRSHPMHVSASGAELDCGCAACRRRARCTSCPRSASTPGSTAGSWRTTRCCGPSARASTGTTSPPPATASARTTAASAPPASVTAPPSARLVPIVLPIALSCGCTPLGGPRGCQLHPFTQMNTAPCVLHYRIIPARNSRSIVLSCLRLLHPQDERQDGVQGDVCGVPVRVRQRLHQPRGPGERRGDVPGHQRVPDDRPGAAGRQLHLRALRLQKRLRQLPVRFVAVSLQASA